MQNSITPSVCCIERVTIPLSASVQSIVNNNKEGDGNGNSISQGNNNTEGQENNNTEGQGFNNIDGKGEIMIQKVK